MIMSDISEPLHMSGLFLITPYDLTNLIFQDFTNDTGELCSTSLHMQPQKSQNICYYLLCNCTTNKMILDKKEKVIK